MEQHGTETIHDTDTIRVRLDTIRTRYEHEMGYTFENSQMQKGFGHEKVSVSGEEGGVQRYANACTGTTLLPYSDVNYAEVYGKINTHYAILRTLNAMTL
ncbi:hypothetical protein M0804_005620 [Polistes exclamans]|nr:hypothetical protein M0804_005620 [Polistes exclamans]